jgi:hypothetical protein
MLLVLLATFAIAGEPATHCAPPETTAFSCPIGKKVLSLCWAGAATSTPLTYRFGKQGKVELSWPTEPQPLETAFVWEHSLLPSPPGGDVRPRLEYSTLSFANEGVTYTVFEDEVDFEKSQGVRILTPEGKTIELSCGQPSATSLQEVAP